MYKGSSKSKVTHNHWENLLPSPYSPDFGLSDYHMLGPLKKHLLGQCLMSDEEVHQEVHSWLMGFDKDFFCSGMGNFVKCWDNCLNKYCD
jgi:hypothetical protein